MIPRITLKMVSHFPVMLTTCHQYVPFVDSAIPLLRKGRACFERDPSIPQSSFIQQCQAPVSCAGISVLRERPANCRIPKGLELARGVVATRLHTLQGNEDCLVEVDHLRDEPQPVDHPRHEPQSLTGGHE